MRGCYATGTVTQKPVCFSVGGVKSVDNVPVVFIIINCDQESFYNSQIIVRNTMAIIKRGEMKNRSNVQTFLREESGMKGRYSMRKIVLDTSFRYLVYILVMILCLYSIIFSTFANPMRSSINIVAIMSSDDLVSSKNTEEFIVVGLDGLASKSNNSAVFSCVCDDSFANLSLVQGGIVGGEDNFVEPEDKSLMSPEYLAKISKQLGIQLELANPLGYIQWQRPLPSQSFKGDLPFSMDGFDPVCSKMDSFESNSAWFRDNFKSKHCNTQPRERALAFVLANLLPQFRQATKVHESSPNSFGLSAKLKELFGKDMYVSSQYSFTKNCGKAANARNDIALDLENQHCIKNETFDIIITQDVFEHIYDTDKAFREIGRTLKPGGFHVFTVPLTSKQFGTFRAAQKTDTGSVKLYAPPEIHGNPMGKGGSLLTMQWGYDIIQYIELASGMKTKVVYVESEMMGIKDAEYRDILISRKDGSNDSFPDVWKMLDSISVGCSHDMIKCTTTMKDASSALLVN